MRPGGNFAGSPRRSASVKCYRREINRTDPNRDSRVPIFCPMEADDGGIVQVQGKTFEQQSLLRAQAT